MKVSLDALNKSLNKSKNLSFGACAPTKSEFGYREMEFSYPFDPEKEYCDLEVFKLEKDENNNYYSTSKLTTDDGKYSLSMGYGSNKVDMAQTFGLDDNDIFGYHFILTNKNSGEKQVMIDAGDCIDERGSDAHKILNVYDPTRSNLTRGGSMKLVIIDSQNVGYIYNDEGVIVKNQELKDRAQKGVKTITNKFGGTLAGLEQDVIDGKYDRYGRIISLPVFTDDDFSAHAYWNKNCMQTASSLGNINNFASLLRNMFAHGLNFVSDGAFVNEGLQGVHFKHLLKWGEKSPYFNWFKASGIKDSPLTMGVFTKNKENISHKIVNSPYTYNQDTNGIIHIGYNRLYDSKRPTYIQFFDKRLVSDTQKTDTTTLIKSYAKLSTDEIYNLHTHNDAVFPYAFEINPKTYNANIKRLNEYNSSTSEKILLTDPNAARILSKFENFTADGKFESGFETWDANPDIAKLNFVYSNSDTKALKNIHPSERQKYMDEIVRGNFQVQDYAVESGKYWTKTTDDILRLYTAQIIGKVSEENPDLTYRNIISKSDGKTLPTSIKTKVSKEEITNVLDGLYQGKRKLSTESKRDFVLRNIMETPLDSFEFGDNLVAVLASPLVSKRANSSDEVGVSRFDIYKKGNPNLPEEYQKTYNNMENLLSEEINYYTINVLEELNNKLGDENKIFRDEEITTYGKYIIPIIVPQIVKYAVVKSLSPASEMKVSNKNGEISYNYNELKKVNLYKLGITDTTSPQDEAIKLTNKIRSGVKKLQVTSDHELVKALYNAYKNTNAHSFELADLIIDKTQSGLDWRIDATKDIGDMESFRNNITSFDYTKQTVINFWRKFNQTVLSQNPNAYTVAEITDEFDRSEHVKKLLNQTGISAIANYAYFFSLIPKIFTQSFDDGSRFSDDDYAKKIIHSRMVSGDGFEAYIKTSSLDSLLYSYTFIGNHDKPRALHCASMNMDMFYADLTDINNKYRTDAYKMLKNKIDKNVSAEEVSQYDFSAASPKAIALAYAIHKGLINTLNQHRAEHKLTERQFNNAYRSINKSISDLSQGKLLGKRFDPDAFGIKPIDIAIEMVLKQAKAERGLTLSDEEIKSIENDAFEKVLEPAISKLLGIMKYIVALPGMPTLFDGDDCGSTGYDTKTRNMFLQNRGRIHNEWLEELNEDGTRNDKYKAFIKKHYEELNDVMAVRTKPECDALNNGAPFVLPMQYAWSDYNDRVELPVIFRENSEGKMAISVFNNTGLNKSHEDYYRPWSLHTDRIALNYKKIYNNEGQEIRRDYFDGSLGVGIRGLKEGTIFRNANNPDEKYIVHSENVFGTTYYYLSKEYGDIEIKDTTLILYHDPKDNGLDKKKSYHPTFSGQYNLAPASSQISKAYRTNFDNCGKKLSLISR